ncbi:MAG: acetyltransferase [Bacteroidales bacterium]|jgi:sugar O-acyltransferase (sialic acid O-acetyltransferase NeuD family)|nr:acetyltransferase [Bacteroidales bacterium]MBP9030372.1 acetyltransferase [Bacteroidales bacterium]HOG73136.1 acetyltransferase [Tenuifilaceae bacterium]
MSQKEQIILVGGGGQCRASIDVIEQQGLYEIAAIVDIPSRVGQNVLGYPISFTDDELPSLATNYKHFLITVGQIESPQPRLKLFRLLKQLNVSLPVIISPLAYISPHSEIGEGTIIMHHVLVNAGAVIGKNCIINSKALVEHDTRVEDFCHISTGAILNGEVTVGEQSFIGSNATLRQGVTIPVGSFIKANTLVK